jgi:hypothetical protein
MPELFYNPVKGILAGKNNQCKGTRVKKHITESAAEKNRQGFSNLAVSFSGIQNSVFTIRLAQGQ